MTQNQFVEKIERRLSRGIHTDESRWDRDYLISKCNDARAVVIRNDFIQNRRWHSQLIQKYSPKFEKLYQTNACITRFRLATPFVNGDTLSDGFISAGNDPVNSESNPYSFVPMRRIKDRGELISFMQNPVMKKIMLPAILIEGMNVEIYSANIIYNLAVYGVFYEPEKIRGFRPDRDEYLITGDMAQMAEDIIFKSFAVLPEPDTISSTKEDAPKR